MESKGPPSSEIEEIYEAVANVAKRFDSFLDYYEKQNRELLGLNRELIQLNKSLLAELKQLVELISMEHSRPTAPRSVPRAQAKDEILRLFKKAQKTLFYGDIAEELGLEVELVVELCNELEKEGQIGEIPRYSAKDSKLKPN